MSLDWRRGLGLPSWLAFLLLCGLPGRAASAAGDFGGAWDLTITTPSGELASWIDITEAEGGPSVRMVGVSGHATRLARVEIAGDTISFAATKDEQGFPLDILFRGRLVERRLEGVATGAQGVTWYWQGRRAPSLRRARLPRWGRPVALFNGKDFSGWKLRDESKSGTWKVEDGLLVTTGRGSDLVSDSKFEDFKLHIEFKSGPSSNSGVYLRGRYEVQVETDSASEPPSHHTGGVYGFLDPAPEQPRKTEQWQTFDITLVGRTLTIVQNGITVLADRQIPGITGGALDSREDLPGPICLQGSEPGTVTFRNIVIIPGIQ